MYLNVYISENDSLLSQLGIEHYICEQSYIDGERL